MSSACPPRGQTRIVHVTGYCDAERLQAGAAAGQLVDLRERSDELAKMGTKERRCGLSIGANVHSIGT